MASALFLAAIFLPWWDVGSSEDSISGPRSGVQELLNLRNAPPARQITLGRLQLRSSPAYGAFVSSIRRRLTSLARFHSRLRSWVTSPLPREPSTWQAYCARDAAHSGGEELELREQGPAELNETEDEWSSSSTTSSAEIFNESNDSTLGGCVFRVLTAFTCVCAPMRTFIWSL